MSKFEWGCVVYGAWIVAWLLLEVAGFTGKAPWPTLSVTAWGLESRWDWVRIILLAGLTVLLFHIVFRFPRGHF